PCCLAGLAAARPGPCGVRFRRAPPRQRRDRAETGVSAGETHDVFRIYGDGRAVALQGLTMSVQPGEVVVVFGPSGSGKSTLLRILARLDMPSAGTVTVFGEDIRELRRASLREYRSRVLGYLDQHYSRALAPELTARELVALQ